VRILPQENCATGLLIGVLPAVMQVVLAQSVLHFDGLHSDQSACVVAATTNL
jgi:hypothetical protein